MSYLIPELLDRIEEYLCLGGLFNPELADHDKVRDLLIDCRDELSRLENNQPCTIEVPYNERIRDLL